MWRDVFLGFDFDFKIETEYICDGGKLGTRFKADNEIKKVIKDSTFALTGKFKVFDVLINELMFCERLKELERFGYMAVSYSKYTFGNIKEKLEKVSLNGDEGLFLKKDEHRNFAGKKVSNAIKLKKKFTADLEVIEIDGIYATLQDENGLIVKNLVVNMDCIKIGDILEIEYEQIAKTYVVPVFKSIRYDKMD